MGCTGTKASKAEGDIDRYHLEILAAAQAGDVKRLKDTLDELDRRKASATKKDVLNMGVIIFGFTRNNILIGFYYFRNFNYTI
ncbi:unnamed protein product [Rotaria magnacalcarata]|uniref:Uncharacterized protein n=1 Tax=Rotaria magnacalcarata TaxID=392030 RepID=A0A8S2Y1M5_9BILA|nr:unnamed protein product [Rotaria magnacalcarata]